MLHVVWQRGCRYWYECAVSQVRKAKAENEVKALKGKAEEAAKKATTEDEKLAARKMANAVALAEVTSKY